MHDKKKQNSTIIAFVFNGKYESSSHHSPANGVNKILQS